MKASVHDQLLESLAELRRALPSMRLGQLIANRTKGPAQARQTRDAKSALQRLAKRR